MAFDTLVCRQTPRLSWNHIRGGMQRVDGARKSAPIRPRSNPKNGIASATMNAKIPQIVVEPLKDTSKGDGQLCIWFNMVPVSTTHSHVPQ